MKKVTAAAAVCLTVSLVFAGCRGADKEQTALEGKTLSEIIDLIYEQKDPGIGTATMEVDLGDAGALKYNTGLDSAEGIEEAAVSEAMISAQGLFSGPGSGRGQCRYGNCGKGNAGRN